MTWLVENQKLQNHSSQLLSNHAPATEESIRKQSVGLVTEFELAASEDLGHLLFPRSDAAKGPKSKADMEMVAQNRGNAMLRYKEKKKTRRQTLPFLNLCYELQQSNIFYATKANKIKITITK